MAPSAAATVTVKVAVWPLGSTPVAGVIKVRVTVALAVAVGALTVCVSVLEVLAEKTSVWPVDGL